MKQQKVFIITLILVCANISECISAGVKPAKVDEMFELTSIVWRLAEAREYSQCSIKEYAGDIDTYFAPYKTHPLIEYCQTIRNERGVSYDAISTGAAFLQKKNGKIGICKGYNAQSVAEAEKRWSTETFEHYVELLNDFYITSKFNDFFVSHDSLYRHITSLMDTLMAANIHPEWFEQFYGKPFPDMTLYVCVNNGPSNYGLTETVPAERRGALLGGPAQNEDGTLYYTPYFASIVFHEITHSFANPLADKYKTELADATEKVYPYSESEFIQGAYGEPSIIPYEWLTRLFMVYYMADNNVTPEWVPLYISSDMSKGFIWMSRSFDFMKNFTENRDRYKTIEEFMPQLVAHFNDMAANYDHIIWEWENNAPYVTEVFPVSGSTLDLSQDTVTIKITFSREMDQNTGAMFLYDYSLSNGIEARQEWTDAKTKTIKIPTDWIKKSKWYGLKLLRGYTKDTKGHSIKQYHKITYRIPE